jgi:hypothetical protein
MLIFQLPPKRTAQATAARRADYDEKIIPVAVHIQAARAAGAKNAADFAAYLNPRGIHAPKHKEWTESAVLRCLARLKALGLDEGSLPAHKAREQRQAYPGRYKGLSTGVNDCRSDSI